MIQVLALAVVAAGWYGILPPPPVALAPVPPDVVPAMRGAIHVHTSRSDGTGTVEAVAAAAASAGLRFVVLTDHGNGTRESDLPAYHSGVLVLDGVEINTREGHLVALGLPTAPYPLAGSARDVLEDVHRLGGFAIAAHPASEREELRWSDWSIDIDGLEWLNGDSEWRNEPPWSLARVLLAYPFRGQDALVTLLDRPEEAIARWDELSARRRVVAVAAADAHARIGVRGLGEPYDSRTALEVPSYEAMFRTFSISVTGVTLGGDAVVDGQAVEAAIRDGRVYSTIDALAGPTEMAFGASSGTQTATGGQWLQLDGPVAFRVDVHAPVDAVIQLLRNGVEVARALGSTLVYEAPSEAGAYRVEVGLPGAFGRPPVPWIVSNPIYVGTTLAEEASGALERPVNDEALLYEDGPAEGWVVETSEASLGALDIVPVDDGEQILFRFGLGGAASASPYAAIAIPVGELAAYDRLLFTARASRPMRFSVQLRVPGEGGEAQRWYRSVFVDTTPRNITVSFDDVSLRGGGDVTRPSLDEVASVLFVVDTLNAETGDNGRIWLDRVRYAR